MTKRETLPDDEADLTLDKMLDLVTPENQHGLLWDIPPGNEFGALFEAFCEATEAEPLVAPSADDLNRLRTRSEAYRNDPSSAIPLEEALERIERTLE